MFFIDIYQRKHGYISAIILTYFFIYGLSLYKK